MRIEVFAEAATPTALLEQVVDLEAAAFGDGRSRHDPALSPVLMLLLDGDRLVASLALLHKTIERAGERFRAAGLSAVTTRVAARSHGYGHRLVAAAREHLAMSGMDLGIFTCDVPLRTFYERAGWEVLPGTVLVGGTPVAPFRSDQPGFAKVTLGAFFSEHARRHRAAFLGADVEIYPGDRDRLW